MPNLEKLQADYAAYLRNKYFNGKDIEGEEIYQEVANIGGMSIKGSRFPPTSSYEDPVAYRNAVTASRAEAEKKLLADTVNKENRRPTLDYHVQRAGKQVEPLDVEDESDDSSYSPQDESDDSSGSLQEISLDAWNEVQSAIKQSQSGAGPSNRRP